MKIVIENVSDGETIPHDLLLIRGRVDNLDSSLLEGNWIASLFKIFVVFIILKFNPFRYFFVVILCI